MKSFFLRSTKTDRPRNGIPPLRWPKKSGVPSLPCENGAAMGESVQRRKDTDEVEHWNGESAMRNCSEF